MSWGILSPKSPDDVSEPVTVRKNLPPEDTQKLQLSPHGRGAKIDMARYWSDTGIYLTVG
jgi:hypothetical protein